jgi:multidrug efflux pump subunit AcrA (membrane-fusion protein)
MKRVVRTSVVLIGFTLALLFLSSPPVAAEKQNDKHEPGLYFVAQPATRQVILTGYTRARRIVDIVSEEAGRCLEVQADIGDVIGKDGIFAFLDNTFINLAINKNQVEQKRLEKTIAFNTKEVRRYEKLVSRDTAAQSKLDELQNRLDQSEFQRQALGVEEANLKERKKRHVIRISSGWEIIERDIEPGEWVSVGKHLGKAGDYRTLLVPFSLSPEEYNALRKLEAGPTLYFPDEGDIGMALQAKLERVSPAFDPTTRKISVDLAIMQGLSRMRGGLRAELTLEIPDPSGAVLVPTSEVSERYEEFWLTRENGQQVRVVLLDHGPDNTSRVRSPEVSPGDKFKAHQATTDKVYKTTP